MHTSPHSQRILYLIIAVILMLAFLASPAPASVSELYSSPFAGVSTQITPFAPITANYSVADLASCYFPQAILGVHRIPLTYKYESGHVNLRWDVTNNKNATHFEVQRSTDGSHFSKIGSVMAAGNSATEKKYKELQISIAQLNKKYEEAFEQLMLLEGK